MCNEVMCQRLCSTWEHYPKEGSTKGLLPWLNWKEILFKNILTPPQAFNKINNNKCEERASRT